MKMKKAVMRLALALTVFASTANASQNFEQNYFNYAELGGVAVDRKLQHEYENLSELGFNLGVGKRTESAEGTAYVYSVNYLKAGELTAYSANLSYVKPLNDTFLIELGASAALQKTDSNQLGLGFTTAVVAPLNFLGVPAANNYAVKFYTNVNVVNYSNGKLKTGTLNGVDTGLALQYSF